MEDGRKRCSASRSRLVIIGIAVAALTAPPAARAARGVINANQHPVNTLDGCSPPLPEPPDPAFSILGASPDVSMQAYHVSKDWADLTQARCYNHFEKPRIFSDDASFAGLPCNSRQLQYIDEICDDIDDTDSLALKARGVEHYEHWEGSLSALAKNGDTIGGYSTWPAGGCAQTMLLNYASHVRDSGCAGMKVGSQPVVPISPNGTLRRDTGTNPRRLLWNGNPATLIGFGHMGALAANERSLLVGYQPPPPAPFVDGYLGSLRKYGANLTRIWAIEQFSGLATCHEPLLEGLTPFSGSFAADYNLSVEGLSPAFFRRLRQFAQLAADRGIVVQLSLWDRHSLVHRTCQGAWGGSPYNMENNTTQNPRFIDGSGLDTVCACRPCGRIMGEEPEDTPCNTIDEILNDSHIVPIHRAYLQRVAHEVGGVGNMIFEIMNEMYADRDWPSIGEGWQRESVAAPLSLELPVWVSRDAFNDEDAIDLAGKPPDAGPISWLGVVNAKVWPAEDPETQIRMGKVRAFPDSTAYEMKGALAIPISPPNPRTALAVRANIWRQSGTKMELGFSSGGGEWLRVELTSPQILSTASRVAITKKLGPTTYTLASAVAAVGFDYDIQLFVDLSDTVLGARGTVYVNSAPVAGLTDIALSTLPVLNYAEFRGSRTGGYYTYAHGSVDNFEADVYCSDPNPPFNCAP